MEHLAVTIRGLIERQRQFASSADPVERFRTIWLTALLDQRLSECPDRQIGRLMDLVQERLGILEPEFSISEHAKRRLLRSSATVRPKR